jgi:hypothetical protein
MNLNIVMPWLDPGICFRAARDRRVKPGDDETVLAASR